MIQLKENVRIAEVLQEQLNNEVSGRRDAEENLIETLNKRLEQVQSLKSQQIKTKIK